MVRKRRESTSWKIAVLAPIPRASVRTATRVKPRLRRRNRKAWRRSRQSEVIASSWQYKTAGGLECHGVTLEKGGSTIDVRRREGWVRRPASLANSDRLFD